MDYRFQPKGFRSNLGWYDRGYIPHFDGGQISQFLTFRLFDSLPQSVIEEWRKETSKLGEQGKTMFRKNVEKYLDKSSGSCFFKDERIATLTEESLLFHHSKKYDLTAWVIMPNHIHFLATPFENVDLSEIAHSIKSYTAHEANKLLNRRANSGNTSHLIATFAIDGIFSVLFGTLKTIRSKEASARNLRIGDIQARFIKRLERNRPGCSL